jgi:two-component system OmpR family response regulator
MLEVLLRSAGQLVSRDALLKRVWGIDFDPGTNRVDVTLSRLRKAIADAGGGVRIETVRGTGFRLVPDP